jgi:hypothetical protein
MEHLVAEGQTWALARAADLAEETLGTVLELANTGTPHPRARAGLARDIAGFASNLLSGDPVGTCVRR